LSEPQQLVPKVVISAEAPALSVIQVERKSRQVSLSVPDPLLMQLKKQLELMRTHLGNLKINMICNLVI
jgi:hypothetical protein